MFKELFHAGVAHDENPPGRGSGRYGWGTGKNPNQHQRGFLVMVDEMKKDGIKESDIAKALLGEGKTTTDLRAEITIQKNNERKANYEKASKLFDKYGSYSEVGRIMGKNESTIRSMLDPSRAQKRDSYTSTANMLKEVVEKKGIIDVGKDALLYNGINDTTKKVAIAMLEKEGYVKTWIQIPQAGTDKKTSTIVLAPPGTEKRDIQANKFDVKQIQDYTPNGGKEWWTPEFPKSLDSKRVFIRYNEEGGKEKDGVIELRRGVEDISLGGSQYSQVRIAVDDTHYMKGMAIYSDDIPKGYDVVYNTNKHVGTPMIGTSKDNEVLKRLKIDEATGEVDRENPFGALIKSPKEKDGVIMAGGQRHYTDENGNKQLSPINKLQDEGDWDSWSRNLSSQFLSKQPMKLIKQQIDISVAQKEDELDKIMNLTNPVIKKSMLEDFAKTCDKNAADLSVKGFKNQAFQVLIPVPELKSTEIYAPNYDDGDVVALVRYPHGGTFEIPILTVNNKHPKAKSCMKDAYDAVGINSEVAERLSGADFDGDTALVIPVKSNRINIKSTKPLNDLKGFDAKEIYKLPEDAPRMKNDTKQMEMGKVTNLITDMTVAGASPSEIARAVKHSQVVIDAEKHHLDYKQSYKDNGIYDLKKEYQGINEETGKVKGASTIFSRSGAKVYIPKRKEVTDTKKMTPEELKRWNEGKIVWRDSEETKLKHISDPKKMTPEELQAHNAGKKVYRQTNEPKTQKVYQMDMYDDARDLVRDKNNPKEMAYAEYANNLKELANKARKEYRNMKPVPVDRTAKETYKKEVKELESDLRLARMNAPRERQAQAIANKISKERIDNNPDWDFEHRQRERARALTQARALVGAKKEKIVITDRQWEAIQANAISTNKLQQILLNTDQEAYKKRATPKQSSVSLSPSQINFAKAMANSGMYTQKEIADRLGVSASTVSKALRAA